MRTKLAICIPAYNDYALIKELFEKELDLYTRLDIHVYIYDSSTDDSVAKLTNSNMLSHPNLKYVRFPSDIHSNLKVYKIFEQADQENFYDYVWVRTDALRADKLLIQALVNILDASYDIIVPNAEDICQLGIHEYNDINEFFEKCAWHMTMYGSAILRIKTMLHNTNWSYLTEKYIRPDRINFSHVALYFENLAQINFPRIFHIGMPSFMLQSSSLKKQATWYNSFLKIWLEYWPDTVNALPECYKNKSEAILGIAKYSWIFSKSSVKALKDKNIINSETYEKYKTIWPKVTGLSEEILRTDITLSDDYSYTENKNEEMNNMSDFCRQHPLPAIYGCGKVASTYADYLDNQHIKYLQFIVSDDISDKKLSFRNHSVECLNQFLKFHMDYPIVLALSSSNQAEAIFNLAKLNYNGPLYSSISNKEQLLGSIRLLIKYASYSQP